MGYEAMLQLEYICTEAEMREAQSLHERQHYGGGSKWRARLALYGLLALSVVPFYFRFRTEIEAKDRPWFIALVVVIFVGVLGLKRVTRRKSDQPTRLKVSERELVFITNGALAAM